MGFGDRTFVTQRERTFIEIRDIRRKGDVIQDCLKERVRVKLRFEITLEVNGPGRDISPSVVYLHSETQKI